MPVRCLGTGPASRDCLGHHGLAPAQPHVNVLAAHGLAAVHGEAVSAGLERLQGLGANPQRLVVAREAAARAARTPLK